MIFSATNPLINCELTTREICKPLYRHFKYIDIFTFGRFYYNQKAIMFSTHKDMYLHFFARKMNFVAPFPEQIINRKFHYVIMEHAGYHQVIQEAISNFGIGGGLNIVDVQDNYCDIFAFCVNKNHLSSVNDFIAQESLLEKFCLYFKEKIRPCLVEGDVSRIFLPEQMHVDFSPIKLLLDGKQNQKSFIDEINLKKYSITINGIDKTISKSELCCLQMLAGGLGAKETAHKLDLSSHTVNTYVRNLKQKFECYSRVELLRLFKSQFGQINI